MATYRKLLSDPSFLKVQMRANQLNRDCQIVAAFYRDRRLLFRTASGTFGRKVIWTQELEITDAFLDNLMQDTSFHGVENLLKDSGIKVYCNCPSFLYWGYRYKAWRQGYGINKETRAPKLRNPYLRGYVCKHLFAILQLYPQWSKMLAPKFRDWALKNSVHTRDKSKPSTFNKSESLTNKPSIPGQSSNTRPNLPSYPDDDLDYNGSDDLEGFKDQEI